MSKVRVSALEAAVDALRERNEVLETDRRLLGARVAELEARVVTLQRELNKTRSPSTSAGRGVVADTRRLLSRLARGAGRRRRATRTARRDPSSDAAPPARPASRPNWPATRRRLKVLGVLDTMSAICFAEVVELTLPDPETAPHLVREGDFDLVLIESAWQGNGGSWQYQVGSYTGPGHRGLPALRRLVEAARKRGIPTVFWNKEDPVHFTKFAEAARICDYVFTTDAHRIGAYQALNGQAQKVSTLQFAAQPSLHNPIGGAIRSRSPVFAGTFYQRRHVDRQGALRLLLEAAAPYGLVIYDRMHGSGQPGYDFPDSVADRVAGSLSYPEVLHEYRRHRVFLNANSVTSSPTMFARRVFELLACGTPVVSTPSRGMTDTFGALVDPVDSEGDAKAALERLLFDDDYWWHRSREGIRAVMLRHTYAHRVARIARVVGLDEPQAGPSVALVCADHDEVRRLHPMLDDTPGIREVVVPSDTSGEDVRLLYRSVDRVVRCGPRSLAAAADRVRSQWLMWASDVLGRDPTMVTDLAVATQFSPAPRVAARPGAGRDRLYRLEPAQPGDVLVHATSGVIHDRDAGPALIAWVEP